MIAAMFAPAFNGFDLLLFLGFGLLAWKVVQR